MSRLAALRIEDDNENVITENDVQHETPLTENVEDKLLLGDDPTSADLRGQNGEPLMIPSLIIELNSIAALAQRLALRTNNCKPHQCGPEATIRT